MPLRGTWLNRADYPLLASLYREIVPLETHLTDDRCWIKCIHCTVIRPVKLDCWFRGLRLCRKCANTKIDPNGPRQCLHCKLIKQPDEFVTQRLHRKPEGGEYLHIRRHPRCVSCRQYLKTFVVRKSQKKSKVPEAKRIWYAFSKADRDKGRANDLTVSWIEKTIAEGCSYCGIRGKISLDRIDNNLGHTQDNCVSACVRCNFMRGNMPYAAWILFKPTLIMVRKSGLYGDWMPCPARIRALHKELACE